MPYPTHYRAAAERVYLALFEDQVFLPREENAGGPGGLADIMTQIFKRSMIERIEAAIRGEEDPLVKVVREARMRKPEKKE